MLRLDLRDYCDAHIVVKGNIPVTGGSNQSKNQTGLQHLKTMHHLLTAFQRYMVC